MTVQGGMGLWMGMVLCRREGYGRPLQLSGWNAEGWPEPKGGGC